MAKINGFKLAALAADKKSTIQLLRQVFVSNGRAFATNLDLEVSAPCDMASGAYNVKGEPLASPAPESDYQGLWNADIDRAPIYKAGDLAALINRVAAAISTEKTRYYLNGVFIEFKGGLKLTATDSHRMLHYDTGKPGADIESFILHRETAKLIASIKGGDWQIRVTPTRLQFTEVNSGVVVISKPINGAYPEYHRVIPKGEFAESLSGDAKACLESIKRCASYGSERSKSVKVEGASLTVRTADLAPLFTTWPVSVEFGTAERRTLDSEGQPVWESYTPDESLTIGFNSVYLRDMLNIAALDKGGAFIMRLRDPASPARIEFPACPGLVGVTMPLRV